MLKNRSLTRVHIQKAIDYIHTHLDRDLSLFQGKVVRELQGERDLNFQEATAIIGRILNRPGLRYVQISLEQAKQEWRESGMSSNVIDLMTEVVEGINARGYHITQARDARTSTSIFLEQFIEDVFVPQYKRVINSLAIL
jgi:hypothetical protein